MKENNQPIRIELPTVFEMGTVNSYLFIDPVPTLIDCGEKSDASWKALIESLSAEGLKITDIERVIITHAHVDHMGMAARVADASGAKVWVSELVEDWAINLSTMQQARWKIITELLTEITNQKDSPLHQGFAKFFNNYTEYWDPIPAESVEVFKLGSSLSLGTTEWEVIHAPGHCINQTCFYDHESKDLIAADMLLKIASTPVVDAQIDDPSKRTVGLAEMIVTMNKFNSLELSTVYPGHYQPIIDGNEILQRQLTRIDQRIEQTKGLISEGPKNFFEILDHMYRGRVSGPAIPMMIGYLDVLIANGMIKTRQSKDGLMYMYNAN